MSEAFDPDAPLAFVDLVFPLSGHSLVKDHADVLQKCMTREFPWLLDDLRFGIHPIKLSHGSHQALLSQRSRMLLRVSRERAQALLSMTPKSLQIGPYLVEIGVPHIRDLTPHTTLYAYHVVNPFGTDEVQFMRYVQAQLLDKEIRVDAVCGKHHHMQRDDSILDVYSLMLHGLPPAQSAQMLIEGLGEHRLLGCGLFVPHKSAAAVFG